MSSQYLFKLQFNHNKQCVDGTMKVGLLWKTAIIAAWCRNPWLVEWKMQNDLSTTTSNFSESSDCFRPQVLNLSVTVISRTFVIFSNLLCKQEKIIKESVWKRVKEGKIMVHLKKTWILDISGCASTFEAFRSNLSPIQSILQNFHKISNLYGFFMEIFTLNTYYITVGSVIYLIWCD